MPAMVIENMEAEHANGNNTFTQSKLQVKIYKATSGCKDSIRHHPSAAPKPLMVLSSQLANGIFAAAPSSKSLGSETQKLTPASLLEGTEPSLA
jgi:hypothetical protein